jgi:hypothetical protein
VIERAGRAQASNDSADSNRARPNRYTGRPAEEAEQSGRQKWGSATNAGEAIHAVSRLEHPLRAVTFLALDARLVFDSADSRLSLALLLRRLLSERRTSEHHE